MFLSASAGTHSPSSATRNQRRKIWSFEVKRTGWLDSKGLYAIGVGCYSNSSNSLKCTRSSPFSTSFHAPIKDPAANPRHHVYKCMSQIGRSSLTALSPNLRAQPEQEHESQPTALYVSPTTDRVLLESSGDAANKGEGRVAADSNDDGQREVIVARGSGSRGGHQVVQQDVGRLWGLRGDLWLVPMVCDGEREANLPASALVAVLQTCIRASTLADLTLMASSAPYAPALSLQRVYGCTTPLASRDSTGPPRAAPPPYLALSC